MIFCGQSSPGECQARWPLGQRRWPWHGPIVQCSKGVPGTRTLLGSQILPFFIQFSANNLQNNRLAHLLWELANPPQGKSWIHHCASMYVIFLPSATVVAKVMFFTPVCDSVHRVGCLPLGPGACTPPGWHPPQRQNPSPRPRDGHCSGPYASYWNALFWLYASYWNAWFSLIISFICIEPNLWGNVNYLRPPSHLLHWTEQACHGNWWSTENVHGPWKSH